MSVRGKWGPNPAIIIALITLFSVLSLLSGVPAAQAGSEDPFTVTLSVPECKLISSTSKSLSYKLEKPVDPQKVYFRWDFSNGMDRTLEKNLQFITLTNVDDNTEVILGRGKPSDFQNFNGTTIEAGDFKYTKQGRNPEPKIRRVEFMLKSTTLEPAKNYILKIGPQYEANNGNKLNKTYSWQFVTKELETAIGGSQPVKTQSEDKLDPQGSQEPGSKPAVGSGAANGLTPPVASGQGDGSGGGQDEPLELVSSSPRDGQTGVGLDSEIRLSFNKNVANMVVKNINQRCFSLYAGNEPVKIEVVIADDQMEPEFKRDIVIVPVDGLKPDRDYTLKVAAELQSKGGITLGQERTINFSTSQSDSSDSTVATTVRGEGENVEHPANQGKNSTYVIIILAVFAAAAILYVILKRNNR